MTDPPPIPDDKFTLVSHVVTWGDWELDEEECACPKLDIYGPSWTRPRLMGNVWSGEFRVEPTLEEWEELNRERLAAAEEHGITNGFWREISPAEAGELVKRSH